MKISVSAACTQIRNVTFCGLLTVALAACGAGTDSSSSAAAAADAGSNQSLVRPSVGMIERTPVDSTGTTQTPASITNSESEPPATASDTYPVQAPAAGGSTSDTTTVASTGSSGSSGSGSSSGSTGSGGTSGGSGSSMDSGTQTPSTGTATLDWTPPTQNTDGTVLTNLAGYTVYYGTSPGNLTQSIKIANPGLTAYTMSNLSPGTWYFAVSSYSSSGVESVRSVVISTRI